ncbi:hypothetical protein B7486_70310, partial [cyanobacterium TDX16]
MGPLDGQAAIVTGAAQGIGTGIARRLAGAGADVLITDLNPAGEQVAADIAAEHGVKAAFRRVDVRNKDEVYDMVAGATQELGRLDILVNNAWGGGGFGPLEQKT